jgi:hypothetical protein
MANHDGASPDDDGGAAFAARLSEALAAHFERLEPVADLLQEAAEIPLDPGGGHRPCWCKCGTAHPEDDACDMDAVTTRRIGHAAGQWVDVPVCAPCAVAHATAAR